MSKTSWTKESAERAVANNRGEGKVIFLDGTATLKKCSAMDYLVNHCGYIFNERKVETNE